MSEGAIFFRLLNISNNSYFNSLPPNLEQPELTRLLSDHLAEHKEITYIKLIRDSKGGVCAFIQCLVSYFFGKNPESTFYSLFDLTECVACHRAHQNSEYGRETFLGSLFAIRSCPRFSNPPSLVSVGNSGLKSYTFH